ncbi:MAG: acyltransferase [Planctomycetota bacterium]|nr:acyltransferase [Planctomycetota bacterium]
MTHRIHPTAIIEDDVFLGLDTAVWDHAHIRHSTTIGDECIIGGKVTIAYGVTIGNRVKINSNAYICHGVTIEDGVMISAGVIFTNDRFPRATTPNLQELRSSEPDEHTYQTHVRCGATIGAGCLIGCNIEIGRFAMIGMGSVVTRSVPDFHLVVGSSARSVGYICRCGFVLQRFDGPPPDSIRMACSECDRRYAAIHGRVAEMGILSEDHPGIRLAEMVST